MCSLAETTHTKISVQYRLHIAAPLWESDVLGIIIVVVVLCWIKNWTPRDERGRAVGRG